MLQWRFLLCRWHINKFHGASPSGCDVYQPDQSPLTILDAKRFNITAGMMYSGSVHQLFMMINGPSILMPINLLPYYLPDSPLPCDMS